MDISTINSSMITSLAPTTNIDIHLEGWAATTAIGLVCMTILGCKAISIFCTR